MRPWTALPLLLALAACGGGRAMTSDEAACRAEARRDPAVGEALSRVNLTNAMQEGEQRAIAAAAERRAFANCMRGRGASIPGGGVEPVRPIR